MISISEDLRPLRCGHHQRRGRLIRQGGASVILVRYSPGHSSLDEWVYNAPDIDDSKIIWAREMDAANNQELLNYYKDRKVWLVQPDNDPVSLSPYPAQ